MTEKECLDLVKKEYPESRPAIVAEVGSLYYVDLRINDMADFHTVDKTTKEVSGNIPTMKVLENRQIVGQIKEKMEGSKKKMSS